MLNFSCLIMTDISPVSVPELVQILVIFVPLDLYVAYILGSMKGPLKDGFLHNSSSAQLYSLSKQGKESYQTDSLPFPGLHNVA